MLRRLMAGLLVLGLLAGFTASLVAQDKDKDKVAKDKDAKDKDAKDKDTKDKDKKDKDGEKPKDGGDKGKDGDKTALKWKFEKDKVFYQKMYTKTVQNMKVMNNDVPQTQSQTFYFGWKPTKVEADKVTLEQTIEGVQMEIDIGGNKINYDSTKEATANNPLADYFKSLVGSKFTIELDLKDMKVTKMDGRDEFLRKLVAANPQMKPLLETILSEQALKEMAEPTFAIVPNKDAAKGEKWSRKTELKMGPIGTYNNTYDYTYEGADKNVHTIKVDTTLNYSPPAADAAGQGGLPFKIKGAKLKSASKDGRITFDAAKGQLEKSSVKISLTGELSIEIGGTTTKVDLSQDQESTVETIAALPWKK